jgi:hypothetical protein
VFPFPETVPNIVCHFKGSLHIVARFYRVGLAAGDGDRTSGYTGWGGCGQDAWTQLAERDDFQLLIFGSGEDSSLAPINRQM